MSTEPLLESLADGVLVVREGEVVWANEAARGLFGADPTGRALDALLAPGEAPRLERLRHRRGPSEGAPRTLRLRLVRGDGGAPVTTEARVAHPAEGEVLITLRDATEAARREVRMGELARLASEGRGATHLEVLLQAASPVFERLGWRAALFELDGDSVGVRHIFTSRGADLPVLSFARDLQRGPALTLRDMPVLAGALAAGASRLVEEVPAELRAGLGVDPGLAAAAERSGTPRGAWIPIRGEGGWRFALVVLGADLGPHDFTALQLFGSQIAATDRLERLSEVRVRRERAAAVGEMAAVMAHEVRNPLGVVFNVAVALRRALGEDPEAARLLTELEGQADRLKRVVSELLELTRPSHPEARPTDLAETVREALRASGVAAELLAPAPPPTVSTDPMLLRRALEALLANAREHGRPGGPITVELRQEAEAASVRVTQPGRLPEGAGERIFEPFFTTRPFGTGLGLALVRRIADDLGGSVTAEEDDATVCFEMRLPRANGGAKE